MMSEVWCDVELLNDDGRLIDLFTFYKIMNDVEVGDFITIGEYKFRVSRYDEENDEYWIDDVNFTDRRMWKCCVGEFLTDYWYVCG